MNASYAPGVDPGIQRLADHRREVDTGDMTTEVESPRDEAPGGLEVVRAFVNSVDFETGEDSLGTPAELAAWLAERGLLDAGAPISEADRARAAEVREALRALCLENNGAEPRAEAREVLRAAAAAAPVVIVPDPDGPRLEPAVGGVPGALARLLAIVHAAMAEGTWPRLKACPADDCLWAFYDRSRNRSGHWCSMAVCGNRAKARKYRQRHRGG
jgi:predicted RNA-binding Zn ribbon-like protein